MRKTKLTFDQIFELVNILRSAGAQAGLDATDAAPYQIRINTSDNCLYMRNATNEQWIYIGKIEQNLGITPETINAIQNGGGVEKISAGLDANKPTTGNSTNDLYLATDTFTIYSWTGSAWKVFLSLQFDKLLNYEKYCVNRKEVAYSGKDKIPRLDAVTGKGNFDITGSPERLLGYEIDVQNFKDGDVLVLNTQKNKIVNLPKDDIKNTDLTVSGEAGKVVKVHSDGKVHATLEGSASQIDYITVKTKGIKEGQVLAFKSKQLMPVDKDVFTEESVTEKGEAGKIVRVASDGNIYGKFDGATTQLGKTKLQIKNLADGDVFVYHQATNTIKNEPKNAVGQGKNLILMDGNRVLGDYNGSNSVTVNVAGIVAKSQASYINRLLRMVENLYLALEVAGLNPGGYDGAVWSAYSPYKTSLIGVDDTNVSVTSIVKGDDSIDVDKIELLNVGENYRLIEGDHIEDVMIQHIKPVYDIQRVILTKPVQYQFTPNVARLIRSNVIVNDEGKISNNEIVLLSKAVEFNIAKTRVHLIVKHQVSGNPVLNAEVAFRNSYLAAENFKPMTKTCFFLDQENTERGTTEFVYATNICTCSNANCTCGAGGGMIATIRIKATGTPVTIDSFAAVFNE